MKSIYSLQEYQQLQEIVHTAYESMMGGLQQIGIHYGLMLTLCQYGLRPQSVQEAVLLGRELLREYENQ